MSGTIRGVIEALVSEANPRLNAGVIFKNLYDLLNGHPGTTLIALGYGAGSGTDYPDGLNPFGDNAFAVFRFDTHAGRAFPWYLFLTVGGIGSAVASPVQINGVSVGSSAGVVAASAAAGVGGDQNPWNGTTNADGTDVIPATLWAVPTGGTRVQVVPGSNSTSGTDAANKDNCVSLYNDSSFSSVRFNCVCDDDVFVCTWDEGASGSYELAVLGAFTPNPALSAYPNPLCALYSGPPLSLTSTLSLDVSGVSNPDVSVGTYESTEVFPYAPGGASSLFGTNQFPDPNGGGVYAEFALGIATARTGHGGFRGQLDFVGVTYNLPTLDTDASLNRAVFGSSTTGSVKWVVPWDGSTTPGTGASRAGVSFTRVP